MTPQRWIIWTASLATSGVLLGWSGMRAMREHNRHRGAEQEVVQVRLAIQRVLAVESELPELAFRGRPDLSAVRFAPGAEQRTAVTGGVGSEGSNGAEGGMATRIDAALRSAGVPIQALTSLQPDAEAVLAQIAARGTGVSSGAATPVQVRRVQAVMVLETLTLPQLGKVFDALRRREPDWTVASIDLSPMPIGKGAAVAQRGGKGSDAPLRAVITIRTEFLTPPLPRIDFEPAATDQSARKTQP